MGEGGEGLRRTFVVGDGTLFLCVGNREDHRLESPGDPRFTEVNPTTSLSVCMRYLSPRESRVIKIISSLS